MSQITFELYICPISKVHPLFPVKKLECPVVTKITADIYFVVGKLINQCTICCTVFTFYHSDIQSNGLFILIYGVLWYTVTTERCLKLPLEQNHFAFPKFWIFGHFQICLNWQPWNIKDICFYSSFNHRCLTLSDENWHTFFRLTKNNCYHSKWIISYDEPLLYYYGPVQAWSTAWCPTAYSI